MLCVYMCVCAIEKLNSSRSSHPRCNLLFVHVLRSEHGFVFFSILRRVIRRIYIWLFKQECLRGLASFLSLADGHASLCCVTKNGISGS